MQPTGNTSGGGGFGVLSQYDPNLPVLQQKAEGSANQAGQYQSAADLLPSQLKQAIEEKLNYNQDLTKQLGTAQANYFAAPSAARNQYQDIANPFEREQLVSQATANAYAPYTTLSQILSQRQGNINDIVNAGTGSFNSAVNAQQNQSNMDQTAYQNALQLAEFLYGANNQYGPGTQQYNLVQTKQAQQDASKGMTLQDLMKKYTGQLDPNSIYAIYNQYNYGNNPTNPNTPFNPTQGGFGAPKQTAPELAALGITGIPAKSTNWQLKSISGYNPGILAGGILGQNGIGATKSTKQVLFNPATGQQVPVNANGDIHVIDNSSGQQGYIPSSEFDASQYTPVGD